MDVMAEEFSPSDDSVWDLFYKDKHVASIQSNDVAAWQSFKVVGDFYQDEDTGKNVLLS